MRRVEQWPQKGGDQIKHHDRLDIVHDAVLPEKCLDFPQVRNAGDCENNYYASVEENEEKNFVYFAVEQFGVESSFFEVG